MCRTHRFIRTVFLKLSFIFCLVKIFTFLNACVFEILKVHICPPHVFNLRVSVPGTVLWATVWAGT